MIILSKYKDYYDYLVGIYGRDENKVFDRREMITASKFDFKPFNRENLHWYYRSNPNVVAIAVLGKVYVVEQIEKGLWEQHLFNTTHYAWETWATKLISEIPQEKRVHWEEFITTDENKKNRKPIMFYNIPKYKRGWKDKDEIITAVPLLSSFGFTKFLPKEEIYHELDLFLGWLKDNPPIEDNRTDIEKLQSHGFDKKISFRHRK